jgi:hypothetical protein
MTDSSSIPLPQPLCAAKLIGKPCGRPAAHPIHHASTCVLCAAIQDLALRKVIQRDHHAFVAPVAKRRVVTP